MLLIEKTFNYFKQRFLRKFFYRYGFGSPVSKNIWEAQFKDGKWDYLYADQEALHYKSIAKFYRQYGKGSMLDVGCGQGVLYHYLQQDIHPPEAYLGVDISDTAIMQAKTSFPVARFEQMDFDNSRLEEQFDIIVFNECLYYFKKPFDKLASAIAKNLKPGGAVMVSIFYYAEHAVLWKKLNEQYQFLAVDEVTNDKGQMWKIGIFKP
ncbi:trans-aconitate 2-methyltransferase [Pedobacter psychrotolerans]|uniref:class I SAM-dependent methyltransferase n=1 Tax=Pedobacter psychrotolerans TaxID=1843235 RepID=UPI003F956303